MLLLFVVQSCSYVWLVVTPRAVACQASVSFTGLLKFMSIESVMLSNHLTHCCPLLLLPSICLNISVFSNESAFHMRWPKYWNCSISSSDKYSGLISFRIDDLIPLQSKGLSRVFSIATVQKHQFFGVQPFLWSNSHIHAVY